MTDRPARESRDVVLRCMCGQRYRVRQARAGLRSRCPECGSLIEVTDADLETSFSPDGLIELHEEVFEPRPAEPIADEPLRLAARGSRPGLTGRTTHAHEEALLAAALDGRSPSSFAPDAGAPPTDGAPRAPRTFVADLLASFWCAGNRNNAVNILLTALPLTLLSLLYPLIPFPFNLFLWVVWAIFVAYVLQFYWFVLKATTRGDDEIPWFETDWNMWDHVIRPAWWVLWISFVCSLPALWVLIYLPPAPGRTALAFGALAVGWFFWPIAVMSYAVGESIVFLRPDWLVRCIIGVGPVYAIAWLLVVLTIASWYGFAWGVRFVFAQRLPAAVIIAAWLFATPLVASLNIYFGYVLFRMIGLLFRHHRARFPFKF